MDSGLDVTMEGKAAEATVEETVEARTEETGKKTEKTVLVRTLSSCERELEAHKQGLEALKPLYWDLQDELDRVDAMRKKSILYFALKRENAMKKHRIEYESKHGKQPPKKLKINIKHGESCDNWDCDGSGYDEVDC